MNISQIVTGIQWSPTTVSLVGAGSTQTVTATAVDPNGYPVVGAPITWGTNDASVATVDAGGTITAVGNGSTGITITSGGTTEVFLVTVSGAESP